MPKKKTPGGHKAKKKLPLEQQDQSIQKAERGSTGDRAEVRKLMTHRQGRPK